MKELHFTREQVTKILENIAKEENGMHEIMKMSLEALMRAERNEHNDKQGDMSNGYRPLKAFGKGKILELKVPRSRAGSFYPIILGMLRDQDEESRRLAFSLYGAGLTTQQVGELFDEIYGRKYSTSQISRMFNFAREEVKLWLERPLEPYYPIIYIDATFIHTRRLESVSKEAYYTILGVRPDRTREVLAIVNFPTESALAWEDIFASLKQRGMDNTGLVVADALSSIENAIWRHFPSSEVQLCTVHLERNVLKHAKTKDKGELATDLKEVISTGDKSDSPAQGWNRWQVFCQKWGKKYPAINRMGQNERYRLYFTYLGFDYRIQNMIYSTNWIERLNRDYKRTTRMRGALPNADATILLLGYVAMSRSAYQHKIPKINYESTKFQWTE